MISAEFSLRVRTLVTNSHSNEILSVKINIIKITSKVGLELTFDT